MLTHGLDLTRQCLFGSSSVCVARAPCSLGEHCSPWLRFSQKRLLCRRRGFQCQQRCHCGPPAATSAAQSRVRTSCRTMSQRPHEMESCNSIFIMRRRRRKNVKSLSKGTLLGTETQILHSACLASLRNQTSVLLTGVVGVYFTNNLSFVTEVSLALVEILSLPSSHV